MKKVLAMMLAAFILMTALSSCGSKTQESSNTPASTPSNSQNSTDTAPEAVKTADELLRERYEEPVKLNFVLGYMDAEVHEDFTPENQTAVKKLKEDLNIEITYSWIVNNDQYPEKFGAELAAGNLPDMFFVSQTEFEDLYEQGAFADLTQAYELYHNTDIDDVVNFDGRMLESGKRGGKLYGIPWSGGAGGNIFQTYYNLTQLEKVGITSEDQLPKTIDELEALCVALQGVDFDGDGKIGGPVMAASTGIFDAGFGDLTPIFTAYGAYNTGWCDDGTGTLVYAGIEPILKEPLQKLNDWYNKGFFAKDFAAYDVWAPNSPVVADIIAGKYPIVNGQWWIANLPLNQNKDANPDSNWVIGPYLSKDGNRPTIMQSRFVAGNFTVVSKDCKNPEALFKMMQWCIDYEAKINNPEYKKTMSEEEKKEAAQYVQTWLPFRIFAGNSLRDNMFFINNLIAEGKTEFHAESAPKNSEFWPAWDAYLRYKENPNDGTAWGLYFSRLAPNGGLAKHTEVLETYPTRYNEVYVTTPTMVKKLGELTKYRDSTFLSMVIGEIPVSDFDKYVSEWKAQGGDEITRELNEWYKNHNK
jgi:ABC-type glycerol-3-phosphate transport system substrate-binding protein/uncharacterized short protein YbdD (DUF466 family)